MWLLATTWGACTGGAPGGDVGEREDAGDAAAPSLEDGVAGLPRGTMGHAVYEMLPYARAWSPDAVLVAVYGGMNCPDAGGQQGGWEAMWVAEDTSALVNETWWYDHGDEVVVGGWEDGGWEIGATVGIDAWLVDSDAALAETEPCELFTVLCSVGYGRANPPVEGTEDFCAWTGQLAETADMADDQPLIAWEEADGTGVVLDGRTGETVSRGSEDVQ